MANEWVECVVSDVAAPTKNALVGGPFGSNLVSRDYVDQGVPVIRGQNMGEGRWVEGNFAFVSERKAEVLSANTAGPGDLIFTQRGTLGQVALVPEEPFTRYIVSQSQMKLTVDSQRANAMFLYYYFSADEQQAYIKRNAVQTGVPHTNLEHLRTTPLFLPPLPEQRAVAHILGSLDDKIELNRQMNQTLEAMARALFKSWFVDFDPVRARLALSGVEGANGDPYPLDAETLALFPDRFVDSEMGEIPEGWRVVSFLEVANLLSGGTPQTSVHEYWDGGIPWASAKDVGGAKGLFLLETEKTISQSGLENSAAKLLPALTTVVTARGTVGAYCLLGRDMTMNQTNYGLKALPGIGDYFVYFLLAQAVDYLRQQSYGTIFDTITTKTFRDTKIVRPGYQILKAFQDLATPIMSAVLNNSHESRTLAELRDALLPKLISGELRVPEISATMEAVTP